MSKAVIYARYSSENQSDSFSISAQLDVCRDYIIKQGWELVDEYVDEALSGTSDKRSSFQRMIVDASNNEFDYVIVYAYDRFSRNRYDQVTYKHELRQYGIYVVSVTQPIDHNNPDSVLLESMYEGMAESYSRKLARECVRGSVQAAKNGFWTGGYTPFGYRIKKVDYQGAQKSKLEIDEFEQPIVEKIYSMYLSGDYGFVEIAKNLNSEGLKPRQSSQKARSGDKWTSSSVRSILMNERYTGAIVWGKRKNRKKRGFVLEIPDIVVENCHPAIIPKEQFNKAQSIMASRRTRKDIITSNDYLLSSLVKCKCGQKMVGHSAKSGKYFYYVCNKKVKQGASGCDTPMINRDTLENIVLEMMKKRVFTAKNIESVARTLFQSIKRQLKQKKDQATRIDYEIPKLQRKYNRLVDMAADNEELDLADLAPRIKEIKQQIDTLTAKRTSLQLEQKKYQLTTEDKKRLVREYATMIKQFFDEGSFLTNGTMKKFIDRVEINYPEYKIYWKLPNPTELSSGKVLDRVDLVVRAQCHQELPFHKWYQEMAVFFNTYNFETRGSLKAA